MSASARPIASLGAANEVGRGCGRREVGTRLVAAGRILEAALAKLARPLEDRVGGGAEERVDAPHVADDVQVQGAGLDRLHGLAGEPVEVGVVEAPLEVA